MTTSDFNQADSLSAMKRILLVLTVLVFLGSIMASGCAQITSQTQNQSFKADQAFDTLRVLIYNVRHGAGMDHKLDLERTAAVIAAQQADIVLLQEIDSSTVRTGGVYQAARLARLSGMPYHAFGPFMDYDGGAYGMAALSAWPILSVSNHRLPSGSEPRTALAIRVKPGDQMPEMVFAGIHFYQTEEQRLAQAQRLVDVFAEETAPVFLAGDFNSKPDDPVMRLMDSHWTRPLKPVDARRTFPADTPRVEIDYFLYRPREQFTVIEHRVIDEPIASDHRPVLLVLAVRNHAEE